MMVVAKKASVSSTSSNESTPTAKRSGPASATASMAAPMSSDAALSLRQRPLRPAAAVRRDAWAAADGVKERVRVGSATAATGWGVEGWVKEQERGGSAMAAMGWAAASAEVEGRERAARGRGAVERGAAA